MIKTTKIGLCIALLIPFLACNSDNNFPDTPELSVRSFEKISDSRAVWKLGFTDGDGDIGVRNDNDADNFIVTIFGVIDGNLLERQGQFYRIPVVQNIRTDKGIEGEFEFELITEFLKLDSIRYDSAMYQGYVVDRSGKQSNVVETPIFPI